MTVKRLLVTGGAGFIGANFVHYWLANHPGDRVVVLDALTYAGNIETLTPLMGNPNFRFVKGNICNNELVELLLQLAGATLSFIIGERMVLSLKSRSVSPKK